MATKPALERFFQTLRQWLLEHLPGYEGPDVAARGKNVEGEAFYCVIELEQINREWVGRVHNNTARTAAAKDWTSPGWVTTVRSPRWSQRRRSG